MQKLGSEEEGHGGEMWFTGNVVLEETSMSTWTARKTNIPAREQMKPETSLAAKMTKLKLFCLGHIMREQGSLGKTVMQRKRESSGEKEY